MSDPGSLFTSMIEPLLGQGEAVLWTTRPTRRAFRGVGRGFLIATVVLVCFGVVACGISKNIPTLFHGPAWTSLIAVGVGIVAFILAAFMIIPPVRIQRARKSVVYAITDRRVLIGRAAAGEFRVQSFGPWQLQRACLSGRGDGVLLVPFSGGRFSEGVALSSALGGNAYDYPPGLFGIEDPREVLRLLGLLAANIGPRLPHSEGAQRDAGAVPEPTSGVRDVPVEISSLLGEGETIRWLSRADGKGFARYLSYGRVGIAISLGIGLLLAVLGALAWRIFGLAMIGGAGVLLSAVFIFIGGGLWLMMHWKSRQCGDVMYAITSSRLLVLRISGGTAKYRAINSSEMGELAIHWQPSGFGEILFRNVASQIGQRKWNASLDLPTTSIQNVEWIRPLAPGAIGIRNVPKVQQLIRDLADPLYKKAI